MQHNAKIAFFLDKKHDPFTIFLEGFGAPEDVKRIARLATRGKRRQIVATPEMFAVNLFSYAANRTRVHIFDLMRDYLWHYSFNFMYPIPSVHIRNPSNGLSEELTLFDWLGQERHSQRAPAVAVDTPNVHKGKRRRGRPSILSKLPQTPPPLYYDIKKGIAVYAEDKQSTPLHFPKARKKVRIS